MFYTFVDMIGDKLYCRYYENKEPKIAILEPQDQIPYDLYVVSNKTPNSDQMSLFGEPLSRVQFESPIEMLKFYKENRDSMKIHGQHNPVKQYIAKTFFNCAQNCDVRVLNFDIETEHRNSFADAESAQNEILSISMNLIGQDQIVFGLKRLKRSVKHATFIQCKDEKELLVRFVAKWREMSPEYITGWNIRSYDIPYVINRLNKVFGPKMATRLSPFWGKTSSSKLMERKEFNSEVEYFIFGIIAYDYLDLYKKYSVKKQETYKLDHIAFQELKENKVSYADYNNSLMDLYDGNCVDIGDDEEGTLAQRWMRAKRQACDKRSSPNSSTTCDFDGLMNLEIDDIEKLISAGILDKLSAADLFTFESKCESESRAESYVTFIEYNVQDTKLVERLDNKLKFIRQAIRIGHIAHSQMNEIFATVKPWDNMIYARLLQKGIQIPPMPKIIQREDKFEGAYVKKPLIGYHRNLGSFDLKSLYPSIIRMLNMSPETLMGRDMSGNVLMRMLEFAFDTQPYKDQGYAIAANGSYYRQDISGVIPESMAYLMEERDNIKNRMKAQKRILEKVKEKLLKIE